MLAGMKGGHAQQCQGESFPGLAQKRNLMKLPVNGYTERAGGFSNLNSLKVLAEGFGALGLKAWTT
jgi:hypothetical protein